MTFHFSTAQMETNASQVLAASSSMTVAKAAETARSLPESFHNKFLRRLKLGKLSLTSFSASCNNRFVEVV